MTKGYHREKRALSFDFISGGTACPPEFIFVAQNDGQGGRVKLKSL
jgi:hypothetical protein